MNFPTELAEATSYLSGKVTVCESHEDGRVNSITDEATVIQLLQDRYGTDNIIAGEKRHWWDVKVFGYPVNIKSSAYGSGADNFSSKQAVVWALTSMSESEVGAVKTWAQYEQALLAGCAEDNKRDYYIISIDKRDGSAHLSSVKTLAKLSPAGNNLPFQVRWKDNTQPVQRSYQEAYDFVVGAYKESVRRKLAVHQLAESL